MGTGDGDPLDYAPMPHAVRPWRFPVTLMAGLLGVGGLAGCDDSGAGDDSATSARTRKKAAEAAEKGTSASGSAEDGERAEAGRGPGPQPGTRFDPPDPDDPLARRVHAIAADRFAQQMLPASPMHRGSLEKGSVRNYQAVLKPLRCYRVIAAGGDGVEDLDLMLFDRGGVPVQTETGTDATPVLGLAEPLCPQQAGVFRLQVKMFKGAGEYGVRIFRTRTKMERKKKRDDG